MQEQEFYPDIIYGKNGRIYYRLPKPKKKRKPKPKSDVEFDNSYLAEAAKKEMKLFPPKSPVSIIYEIVAQTGHLVNFKFSEIDSTFVCKIIVGDSVGFGEGKCKRDAKHAAAINFIDKLVKNQLNKENYIDDEYEDVDWMFDSCNKAIENAVGNLQEMCMMRKWLLPIYETTYKMENFPLKNQYIVTCTVLNCSETSSSKSKKLAKHEAAHKMLMRLKECPFNF